MFVQKKNEQTLGELFCFFILETILLGRALKVNPFDQPSVELIKKRDKKYFNLNKFTKNYLRYSIIFRSQNFKFIVKIII